jgi:hypothetical protein
MIGFISTSLQLQWIITIYTLTSFLTTPDDSSTDLGLIFIPTRSLLLLELDREREEKESGEVVRDTTFGGE